MNRRTIYLILGAIVTAALLAALYWYWQKNLNTSNTPDSTANTTGGGSSTFPTKILPPPTETSGEGSAQTNAIEPRLFQIHDKPIVSSVSFQRNQDLLIRFMEQGSGNVYEYNFRTKEKTRISNTSIPQIERAVWAQDGSVVAFQYEQDDVIHTAVGILTSSTLAVDTPFGKISFLPEGIRSVALSPDGSQVAYVYPSRDGSSVVVARNDGSGPTILFTSPLRGWTIAWPAKTYITLSSPQSEEGGVTYKISTDKGIKELLFSTTKIFSGILGSAKNQFLLPDPQTGFVTLLTQNTASSSRVTESSWLDKCAFVPNATSTVICAGIREENLHKLPQWERGEFASADFLLSMNMLQEYKMSLIPLTEVGDRVFDMVNITTTPNGDYVSFKNKIDGLLWGVRVPGGIE